MNYGLIWIMAEYDLCLNQTNRQTHQYHDSAWPRGWAKWKFKSQIYRLVLPYTTCICQILQCLADPGKARGCSTNTVVNFLDSVQRVIRTSYISFVLKSHNWVKSCGHVKWESYKGWFSLAVELHRRDSVINGATPCFSYSFDI